MPRPRIALRTTIAIQRQALEAARECLRDCVFLDGARAAEILSTLALIRTALEVSDHIGGEEEAQS